MNAHLEDLSKLNSAEEKLKYLNSVDFPYSIDKKDNSFILTIPCLELEEEGNSLDEVFQSINLKKENYFSEMIKTKAEDEICFPPLEKPAGLKDVLKVFLDLIIQFKTAIIYTIIVLVTVQACSGIGKGIKKSKKRFFEKMQENIENATPEKIAERRLRAKNFLKLVKPFYLELKSFDKEIDQEIEQDLKNKSLEK